MSTGTELLDLPQTQSVVVVTPPVVSFVSSLLIPEQFGDFVVKERFNKNNRVVKIAAIDYGFETLSRMVEKPLGATAIYSQPLDRKAGDGNIFSLVRGGSRGIIMPIRVVYYLLLQQPECQPGELITDGKANLFYVVGSGGENRALSLHASPCGWLVRVNHIVYADAYRGSSDSWEKGCKIYSSSPFRSPVPGVVI